MRLPRRAAIRQAIESVLATIQPSSQRGGGRYRVDPLEARTLLALVPITVDINQIIQLRNPDEFPRGDGDYYAHVTIGSGPERSSNDQSDTFEGTDVRPHWSFTELLDPADFANGLIPITVSLFDSDTPDGDETVDINSTAGETSLSYLYDPTAGTLSAHGTGGDDGEGSAEIFFDTFVAQKVVASVTGFIQIDSPEFFGGDGNYRFDVKFNDQPEQTTGNSITYPPGFGVHSFTGYINPVNPIVKVRFAVVDVDQTSGNELMDINPRSGASRLTLNFDIRTGRWEEEGGAFAWPENRSTGNGDDDRGTLHFDISTNGLDSDGDGLLDDWETNGIDVNGDTMIDFAPNSDPFHKDLFVEIDAMAGRAPLAGVIQDVIDAFAAVPNSLVNNPDGLDGITLHMSLDESNVAFASWATDDDSKQWVGFDGVKSNLDGAIPGGFGSAADRLSSNRDNILAAKRPIFRYAIFADRYGEGSSSGLSEIGGNDLFITMGSLWGNVTRNQQAGTLMHELGHTLGLRHGGGDDINFKPNYDSIMSYTWQLPYRILTTSTIPEINHSSSWDLDYSRMAFPDLDESHLVDADGIGGFANTTTRIGPIFDGSMQVPARFLLETGPIDWNGNGSSSDTSAVDINFLNDRNGDNKVNSSDASPGEILRGYNDWANIQYSFRLSAGYADGVHTDSIEPDMTYEEFSDVNDILGYVAPSDNGPDHLTLRRNGDELELVDDATNTVVASHGMGATRLVEIVGADGEDDTLTIDYNFGGFFTVAGGISFDGGAGGNDRLRVVGTGVTTATYLPGAAPGAGSVVTHLGGQDSTVSFTGLEPVEISNMPGASLITPASQDAVAIANTTASGGESAYSVSGTSGGVGFESLIFFNVTTFTLDTATNDGASPNDTVSVALTGAVTGVMTIQVNTGAGSDAVNFDGDGLTHGLSNTSFTNATRPTVSYGGVETLGLTDGVFNAAAGVSANVNVNAGATLAGIGSITGATTVNTGGTVSPGVAAPGTLTTFDTVFTAGGTFNVRLNGLTPGTQHGVLRVNGTIDLGGAALTAAIGGGFVPLPGDEFVIIHNDGTDAVTGKFSFGDGVVVIGGKKFIVDYNFAADPDQVGNDVALIGFGAALSVDPCDPKKTALFVSATTGDDVIRFVSAAGSAKIRVLINGEDQGIFSPSGTLIGFGQAGNDRITVEVPSKAAWLYGQNGNDTLVAGNGESVLLGGLGDDELSSGNGKDVLIGGLGADLLDAGNGEDLLIAGATDYDTNSPANRAAICAIADEWSGGSGGYAGHISHLSAGVGAGGVIKLNASTITNDSAIDRLNGDNGRDWFLRGIGDIINGKAGNETDSALP
jgi:hypothetical protein